MKKNINKTQKLTAVLSAILILSLVFLFYWNAYILGEKQTLISNKNYYAETVSNSPSINELENKLVLAENAIEFFENIYIDSDNVIEFISFLEQLAVSSDIELNIQTLNSSAENNSTLSSLGHETVGVSLGLRGSWDNLSIFIIMLENLQYHIKINELRVSRTPDVDDMDKWTANISFVGIAK